MSSIDSENRLINFLKETLQDSPPIASIDLYYDSQTQFILNELKQLQGPISLLDYGCGNMRLLNGIINCKDKLPIIEYIGTDISHPINLNPDSKFVNVENIRVEYTNKFDFVVLMNVLHEVSIHNISIIFEDIRRCLKPTGKLFLVDMSVLPEGEPLALPFYTWEFKFLFKEFEDKSYISKSGIPVISLIIPQNAFYFYSITIEKLSAIIQFKRDSYSEIACRLNDQTMYLEFKNIIDKMSLSGNNVHDLGLLMLMSGHANYRLLEKKRKVQPNYDDITKSAVSILQLFFEIWRNEKRLITPNQIFEILGSIHKYDSLWYALNNMSNNVGTFFMPLLDDFGDKELTPSESLDVFEDYYSFEDIGVMGLGSLQNVCHRKIWAND